MGKGLQQSNARAENSSDYTAGLLAGLAGLAGLYIADWVNAIHPVEAGFRDWFRQRGVALCCLRRKDGIDNEEE